MTVRMSDHYSIQNPAEQGVQGFHSSGETPILVISGTSVFIHFTPILVTDSKCFLWHNPLKAEWEQHLSDITRSTNCLAVRGKCVSVSFLFYIM